MEQQKMSLELLDASIGDIKGYLMKANRMRSYLHSEQQGEKVLCTNCLTMPDESQKLTIFRIGEPHQQRFFAEDGMDACSECVGCQDWECKDHEYGEEFALDVEN